MRIDIVNGSVITGDGKSLLERTSLIVREGLISEMPHVQYVAYNGPADEVIDAEGGLILPGIINTQAHGITIGPFQPFGWESVSDVRAFANLNRHLLQGTTTILNLDGLALPFEVEYVNKVHPVNVKTGTLHTPKNFKHAEITTELNGSRGYEERHLKFTAKEAVAEGAVVLGEVGPPGTSGGTNEKRHKLGRAISVQEGYGLDKAVMSGKDAEIRKALDIMGLEGMSIKDGKTLVEGTTFLALQSAIDAIKETVEYVKKLGVPTLVHAEPATYDAVLEVARELGPRVVALHANHNTNTRASVQFARQLKKLGGVVEIITADPFGAKQIEASPEVSFALLKEGLVDIVSTDWSGGYHDAILVLLQHAIQEHLITLPQAIKLATSGPASIIPRLAPNRGLIAPGKIADICIVDRDDISKVKTVLIGGRIAVEGGKLVPVTQS